MIARQCARHPGYRGGNRGRLDDVYFLAGQLAKRLDDLAYAFRAVDRVLDHFPMLLEQVREVEVADSFESIGRLLEIFSFDRGGGIADHVDQIVERVQMR